MTVDLKDVRDIAPEAFDNVAKNLTDEPSKFLGHTGKSILSICFDGINYYAEKLDFKRKIKLENWKQRTFDKLNEIPQEFRQDPPLEIAGPITEASKFYFDNETLSELFSNLLASSCDSSKSSNVHPAFIEIIKQMSVKDAQILNFIKYNDLYPYVNFKINVEEGGFSITDRNVFYSSGNDYINHQLNTTSITNLLRLKLIDSPADEYLTRNNSYDLYLNSPIFINLKADCMRVGKRTAEIEKKYLFITPLGESFISVCVR